MIDKIPPFLIKSESPVFGISHDGSPFVDGSHQHIEAQLMYCSKGIIEAQVSEKVFLIPPTNAIWIPGNVPHSTLSKNPVNYRSVYFCEEKLDNLPKIPQVISISPLLRELILEICNFEGRLSIEQKNIITVLIDQLNLAKQQNYILEIPNESIIKSIYKYVIENLSEALLLDQVAKNFAMSSKSLTRLFQKHVGMTFEQWKQQVKILEAISLLSQETTTTTQVAQALGYSSDSAFIHRFKKMTGKTPMEFKKK
ncbi:AraC family transcriptional regulator [Francisella sp. SYW-9]|uniref:AraC family transcriptional regulator n=1 Tax=Francisella sp. SYW-9 TaxID=2610888 RepID=UPI00123CB8E7|nr:helix-turn-helix transcriptional regulator [Francisella sp. SYW-9]